MEGKTFPRRDHCCYLSGEGVSMLLYSSLWIFRCAYVCHSHMWIHTKLFCWRHCAHPQSWCDQGVIQHALYTWHAGPPRVVEGGLSLKKAWAKLLETRNRCVHSATQKQHLWLSYNFRCAYVCHSHMWIHTKLFCWRHCAHPQSWCDQGVIQHALYTWHAGPPHTS